MGITGRPSTRVDPGKDPMLVIGGELHEDPMASVDDVDQIGSRTANFYPPLRKFAGSMTFYDLQRELVRKYKLEGLTTRVEINEPTDDEKLRVSAHSIAGLFYRHNLDMQDVEKILDWALSGIITSPRPNFPDQSLERVRLEEKLSQMLQEIR